MRCGHPFPRPAVADSHTGVDENEKLDESMDSTEVEKRKPDRTSITDEVLSPTLKAHTPKALTALTSPIRIL